MFSFGDLRGSDTIAATIAAMDPETAPASAGCQALGSKRYASVILPFRCFLLSPNGESPYQCANVDLTLAADP